MAASSAGAAGLGGFGCFVAGKAARGGCARLRGAGRTIIVEFLRGASPANQAAVPRPFEQNAVLLVVEVYEYERTRTG
jgi:hypothetical protein